MSLKQGAGRLIRSETDRGLLVVCDPRMAGMNYGQRLREALPPMTLAGDEARSAGVAARARVGGRYRSEPAVTRAATRLRGLSVSRRRRCRRCSGSSACSTRLGVVAQLREAERVVAATP